MADGPASPRVLYPGSFDPIHLGHVDVISQARALFGAVVVAVMHNPDKPSGLFGVDERITLAEHAVRDLADVTVEDHAGLAVQAAAAAGADFIVKGLRSAADFDIEQQMAHNNFATAGVRTVYLPCSPELGYVSSRFVRELARYGGDVTHLVPAEVAAALDRVYSGKDTR